MILKAGLFQINRVTSWIDGSFIYSTSEAWINAMRSFKNGTLLSEPTNGFPVRNTMRVPLFNNPVPNILRTLSPERLFRKCNVVFPLISIDDITLLQYYTVVFYLIVSTYTPFSKTFYCTFCTSRVRIHIVLLK